MDWISAIRQDDLLAATNWCTACPLTARRAGPTKSTARPLNGQQKPLKLLGGRSLYRFKNLDDGP